MTYATAAGSYAQAGWTCIIPVPPHTKHPPPLGFTGADGRDTLPTDLEFWAGQNPDHSVALRMPDGIIGIDVDHYTKGDVVKTGADQLAERIAQWGPLPPTWSSTSRGSSNGGGPGLSRIMFFRVPPGKYATTLGPDIEIIQRHHRYAVVAPSVHPDIGATYGWYTPDDHRSERPPAPSELAELPQTWVTGLAEGAAKTGPAAAGYGDGQALLGQLAGDDRAACVDVAQATHDALTLLQGALPGSRHDTMTERVYHLVLLGAEGHPGTGPALARLEQLWDQLTAGENRGGEFAGMLTTAARKAVTSIGATQMRAYDPCLTEFGVPVAAPQADVPDAPEPDGLPGGAGEPPRIVSIREYITAEPFDPPGSLDHTLAQAVLERMFPALRYAADADTWLLRGPWVWATPPGDLSQWAVTELTWLMPRGDAQADKDTAEGQADIQRAARRKRFGSTAGASAISKKMRTHVMAGTHPSSVELAGLDADPEILWAGGVPWDLRASAEQPTPAAADPATPHLHSAGYLPQRLPTPLWDAYIRAVWPDPELRAWALRVLSVAFTGYPDKSLPILRGDPDRGKALALDTPVPTPSGWTTMGELNDGDTVYDEAGQPCLVKRAWPVRLNRQCYDVEFSDGSVITADAEHLWYAETALSRRNELPSSVKRRRGLLNVKRAQPVVITTEEMARNLRATPGGRLNYSIPVAGALQCPDADLTVPPYTLGAWLGDGSSADSSITSVDPEILEEISTEMEARHTANRPSMAEIRTWPAEIPLADAARALGLEPPAALWQVKNGKFPAQVTFNPGDRDTWDTCPAGHSYDAMNSAGYKICKRCQTAASQRAYAKRLGKSPAETERTERVSRIRVATASVIEARDQEQWVWLQKSTVESGRAPGYCIKGLMPLLRSIGVLGNKHIPVSYLRASETQRRALLAGLLDTDGRCNPDGSAEYYSSREQLARDVYQLVCSLGYKARLRSKTARMNGKDCGITWTVAFNPGDKVFRLTRKLARQNPGTPRPQSRRRYVTAIRPVPSVPVRCITVNSPNHLYLAGTSCIPTHNTATVALLMDVLGTYAHAADTKVLSGADRSHASIIMALKGRRLSFIDEAPRSGHQAQERLKQLTGGGALTGNFMQKNPVTFKPSHTLVLTANEEAEPPLTDPAVRRRVRLIPCTGDPSEVIAARAAIGGLDRIAWRREAPGVLAAMMAEAAAWLGDQSSAYSSAAPLSAQDITEQIAAGQDYVRGWVENETEPWPEGTRSRPLYQEFVVSCRQSNIPATAIPSETLWGRRLSELGYPAERQRTGSVRRLRTRRFGFDGGFGEGAPVVPVSAEVSQYTSRVAGSPENGGPVAGSGRFENKPATDDIRRSDPPLSSSVAGVAGSKPIEGNEEEDITPIYTENNGHAVPTCHANPLGTLPDQAKEPVAGGVSDLQQLNEPATAPDIVTEGDENQPASGDGTSLPETVDASDTELVTESETAPESPPKPEKRSRKPAKPKPPKRVGPDPELAGEIYELPAAVNRAGDIVSCTIEQAIALAANDELTVDVETTGYPIGHPLYKLRTVQLGDENLAVVFDAQNTEHQAAVQQVMAAAKILHAHSAVADLVPTEQAGMVTEAAWLRMDDTVLHAKLADPQLSGSDADGLKQLAADVVPGAVIPAANEARKKLFASGKWLMDTTPLTPIERSGWAQVDSRCATMIVYAASDVLDTAPLPRLLPQVDQRILEREQAMQRICARVAHRGVRLDPDHVHAKLDEHRGAKAELMGQIQGTYQIENPGSAQQVAVAFAALGAELPRTKPSIRHPQGQPSTEKAVLLPLKRAGGPAGELASIILEFRSHATVLNLLLEPFGVQVDHGDGRARPTVYTLGADTGRTSCVRPNLQQLSRQGGVRACITADPGMIMISADFQAVELRTAAALAGDAALYELIREGDARRAKQLEARAAGDAAAEKYWKDEAAKYDLHWRIAKQVWGPDAGKDDRYNAKRGVFGRLYGSGIPGIAKTLGITEGEAQAVADTLDAMAPGVAQWSRGMQQFVKDGGTSIQAYSGRTIWLDRKFPHKAGNYCLSPETPILHGDLTYRPVGDIEVGDSLVGFDEYKLPGNGHRRMRMAVTEKVSVVQKPSVRVVTDDRDVVCSEDHMWLVRPVNRHFTWRQAKDLRLDDELLDLGTWKQNMSRTAGWLAGLYDGEGHLSMSSADRKLDGHHGARKLEFAQLPGRVMDSYRKAMAELGLPYMYRDASAGDTSRCARAGTSGMADILRVLGTLQPVRFQPKYAALLEGASITGGTARGVPVRAVEPVGVRELMSVQTSTRTLIADGFLSHNCIQGTAREFLVDGLLKWDQTEWADCVMWPVHDEVDVVVPEADAERATAALVECMSTELAGMKIIAEPSEPSFYWADAA